MVLRTEEEILRRIRELERDLELNMQIEPRDMESELKAQALLSTMSGMYWCMNMKLPSHRNFRTGEETFG